MASPPATLVEMFARTTTLHAARPALGTRGDGSWTWTSYADLRREVDRFRAGLASLRISEGDRVAIVSNNRLEWVVAAYATYERGAAFVPIYEAQKAAERDFILKDSGARVVIAATADIARAVRQARSSLPELEQVIELDRSAELTYSELLRRGDEAPVSALHPTPDAPATVIYTSGTTGKPKGVILSHGSIMSNVNSVHEVFDFSEEDRSLAFIPWAHVFGQTCELHTMLSLGASIAINDDLKRLPENLREVKPTILVAVPRIFNRFFASIQSQLAERGSLVHRLFDAGLRAARNRRGTGKSSRTDELALRVADHLIFSKVRERFGGRLKYAVSGGAALAKDVAELIQAVGITVYEGYGLTETSPMVSANRPGAVRLGSVGKLIPGVSVRIEPSVDGGEKDGEIVVYGPNVMKGYHNRPDEQAKAFTPDGGLRTGDLGYLDEDGFLFVTGRIKERYKLENGKYVAPVPLEEQLKLSPYIANVMIHGANKPHNVALIVLDVATVEKWARSQGLTIKSLTDDPRVVRLIRAEVEAHSAAFNAFERPRQFILTTEDFTVENDLLTPSLKLKRPRVVERYGAALDALYREASAA